MFSQQRSHRRNKGRYNELFPAYSGGEVAVKGNSEVVGVVARVVDDMVQQCGLMSQDFRKAPASKGRLSRSAGMNEQGKAH